MAAWRSRWCGAHRRLDPAWRARGAGRGHRRGARALTPNSASPWAQIAMSHARESFGKERMCAQTLAVYQELLRSDAYATGARGG